MSRQQDKVLRAMISLGEFTAADLQKQSEVGAATVRTVLRRFQNTLDEPERIPNGARGGQPCRYRLKPDRVGQLIDRMLVYSPLEGWELDDQRRRLLDLSVAHESLVKIFGQQASPAEQRQLLKLVGADIAKARKQLSSLPKEDPNFARYARRIEEVNLLYLERCQLLDRSEETEKELGLLEEAVGDTVRTDPAHSIQRATVVVVDAVPSTEWFSWGRNLCRGLDDNANARTKLVRFFEDPDGLYDFGWDAEPIAGCIMTVDSSSGDVERLLPAVHFMRRKNPRLMPVLIVDAHQNLEFQHSILIEHGFYTCRDFYRWDGNAIDPSSVLQFFSVIIQSLRIAHHLVRDRTVHEAGRSILNQLMKV